MCLITVAFSPQPDAGWRKTPHKEKPMGQCVQIMHVDKSACASTVLTVPALKFSTEEFD